jgi:hypothetical protein
VMREVEDRSYAEIAEVLGVSVPAVEALLFRARGNLRERRKALAGALSVAPVPTSLGSFFGGGGSLIAAGGTALGSQLVLKAAALVATSVVVGGLGFKAVSAVATPDPPTSRAQQLQGQARLFAPNVLRGPGSGSPRGSVDVSAFRHPLPAVSGGGALGGPSTKDPSVIGGGPGAAQPAGGASAISAVSTSPAATVGGVVGAVPTVPGVPTVPAVSTVPTVPTVPPAVTVTTPVTSATVTVPTVTLPPPKLP